jgi:hypothetical protein
MANGESIQSLQFFVSYAGVDRSWAEWIAWQLEDAGHRVVVQAWDFRPGENFIANMRRALDTSDRTIAVISAAYLESVYGSDEWTAAFIHDQAGQTSLLAVRVQDVPLPRLLRPWIYIDLAGVDQEVAAQRLLEGVRPGRRKPEQPPVFPPAATPVDRVGEPGFPGQGPTISNLPSRNPAFTGRDALLAGLRAQLAADTSVAVVAHALYGLGGVGKTQLALEYAHRYAADYELVWWIPAENPVTISSTLASLGSRLDLDPRLDPERLVAAVLDALRDRGRWLLVFDNAEQPGDVAAFRPAGGGGHLLVTSRNPAWGALGKSVRVDVLPHDQAVSLLLRRSQSHDRASADQLALQLGDLPLALEQAAAYSSRQACLLRPTLTCFDEGSRRCCNEDAPSPTRVRWTPPGGSAWTTLPRPRRQGWNCFGCARSWHLKQYPWTWLQTVPTCSLTRWPRLPPTARQGFRKQPERATATPSSIETLTESASTASSSKSSAPS